MTDLDRDIRACGKFDIAHPYFCGPSERAAISISTAPCTAVCSDDAGACSRRIAGAAHRFSWADFAKKKAAGRASADLWTTNRPDARLANPFTENLKKNSFGATKRAGGVLQSVKRQREYQGYRASASEPAGSGNSMPTLIGAAMIAAAILLSTLINALGSRYVGFESPTEESAWLVDRLTGHVYKCHARSLAAPPARPRSQPAASDDRQKR